MAEIKISELQEATLPLDGTEDLPIVSNAITRRCSTQDIADLVQSTVKVSLSSAEILALNSTPKVLKAAEGAGTVILPVSWFYVYNYGTLTYAANQTMELNYAGITSGNITNTLLSRTESCTGRQLASGTTAAFYNDSTADVTNKDFVVRVSTGNPTTGDGTIDIYFTYKVLTLS